MTHVAPRVQLAPHDVVPRRRPDREFAAPGHAPQARHAGRAQAEEGGGEDLKGADTETIVAALLAALKKLDPAAAKEFEEAGKDKTMAALEDEAEEIKAKLEAAGAKVELK